MPVRKLTIFKFGYHGWGNSPEELKKLAIAVERHNGYGPPIWVDTRIRPRGRARAFNGRTFETFVGPEHYYAIPELGNLNVTSAATSARVRIKSPKAANELLDLALDASRTRQRVIYFCECKEPKHCHRTKIALHLVRAAERRMTAIQVVEWPGGTPRESRISLRVPKASLKRSNVRLPSKPRPLWKLGSLPAGTRARLYDGSGWEETRAVKAVAYKGGEWLLPLVRRGTRKKPLTDAGDVRAWRAEAAYEPLVSALWKRE